MTIWNTTGPRGDKSFAFALHLLGDETWHDSACQRNKMVVRLPTGDTQGTRRGQYRQRGLDIRLREHRAETGTKKQARFRSLHIARRSEVFLLVSVRLRYIPARMSRVAVTGDVATTNSVISTS
jgi:hypothetical protein